MLSCTSLPNSTTSSPRHKSGSVNKGKSDWRPPPSSTTTTGPGPETGTSSTLQQQQQQLFTRSKSCGEGRASTPSIDELQLGAPVTMGETDTTPKRISPMSKNQGWFTCGALCVYLPTFNKAAKTDKRPAAQDHHEVKEAKQVPGQDYGSSFSRRVSMAKFEWGSRSSAAIVCNSASNAVSPDSYEEDEDEEDQEDSMNLYFDLPLELMRYAANDSPEKAAFIFTAYQGHEKTFDKTNSSDPLLSSAEQDSSTETSHSAELPTSH